ncbi:necrosis inducing protein [Colletotrichum zoysiae]|uniref:Necrosis inducing protein n=1 Tax=Colletotrichum zoysiae TaxID=1216348 RepID=A0AAD9HLV5_9PEZI|nr:necrosis inducing protein [Colletotrichum zoysiae]
MTRHSLLTLFSLGLIASASGSTLSARGDDAFEGKSKPHDEIAPFAQQAADGLPGELELQFKPALNDTMGCLPYPAVDADGFHSGGLEPTGDEGGDCRDPSKGQVYSRVGTSNNRTAVLYSWYLPKMMRTNEYPSSRHWYLSVVVWLHTEKCNATAADFTVAGVSYSLGEDAYSSNTRFQMPTLFATDAISDTHPVVAYRGQSSVYPAPSNVTDGLEMPLISWNKLPQPAVDQFDGAVYELARCPFQDANFQASLDAAFSADLYANLKAEPDAATCAAGQPGSRAIKAARALRDAEPVIDGPDVNVKNPPPDSVFVPTQPGTSRRPAPPTGNPGKIRPVPQRRSGLRWPGWRRKGGMRHHARDAEDDADLAFDDQVDLDYPETEPATQ